MIEMKDLIAKSLRDFKEGSIVKGRILEIRNREVLVDIGYKSEGIIPVSEFTDFSGEVTVKPGDSVDVLLERTEDRLELTENRRLARGEAPICRN